MPRTPPCMSTRVIRGIRTISAGFDVAPERLPDPRAAVAGPPRGHRASVRHFAQRFAARMRRRIEVLPTTTLDAMRRYSWPANVRELRNLIERAVIPSRGSQLIVPLEDLAPQSFSSHGESTSTFVALERAYIMHVLEQTNWIVGGARGAAARLGIKRTLSVVDEAARHHAARVIGCGSPEVKRDARTGCPCASGHGAAASAASFSDRQ